MNLSSPKGSSINDGIKEDLASIAYVSIDLAVRQILKMGQGTLMAKTDVQSAFRIIPVHPTDQWLLGMEREVLHRHSPSLRLKLSPKNI